MTWDSKDKALLAASRLVGFCQSVPSPEIIDSLCNRSEMVKVTAVWVDGLRRYAAECAEAVDKALNDSTDGNTK